MRPPFEDPRHKRLEIRDDERETDAAIARALDLLRRMPYPRFDECGLVSAELDDDVRCFRRIAHINSECAMQDLVDLEIGGHVERALAKMIGVGEALHGEDS